MRYVSGQELERYFLGHGFEVCYRDAALVHMARDCENSLWPGGVSVPFTQARLSQAHVEYLLERAGLDVAAFWNQMMQGHPDA